MMEIKFNLYDSPSKQHKILPLL